MALFDETSGGISSVSKTERRTVRLLGTCHSVRSAQSFLKGAFEIRTPSLEGEARLEPGGGCRTPYTIAHRVAELCGTTPKMSHHPLFRCQEGS